MPLHYKLSRALPGHRAEASTRSQSSWAVAGGTCSTAQPGHRDSRQALHCPQHLRRHQRASSSSKGYCHEKPSKEEHEDKVSRPSTEGAFFQHAAVPVAESRREGKGCSKGN